MSKTIVSLKTHRYEFSEPTIAQLSYFTQMHKYDERKTFKESWIKWIETDEVAEMIASETKTLMDAGFSGDVVDKMFKAVRYYFRKKPMDTDEKKEQLPRKKYVGFTGNILTAMDADIIKRIKDNIVSDVWSHEYSSSSPEHQIVGDNNNIIKKRYKSNVSPDKSFADFYATHTDTITSEIVLLLEVSDMDEESIQYKIKKTYKNRYQTIRKKLEIMGNPTKCIT
jgi:hypothetical protein